MREEKSQEKSNEMSSNTSEKLTRGLIDNYSIKIFWHFERVNKTLRMWQILIFLILLELTSDFTSATPILAGEHENKSITSSSPQASDTKNSTKNFNWESYEFETGSKYIDSFTSNEIKSNHETSNESDFGPKDKEQEHESIEKIPINCPSCKNSGTLSEDDLQKLRIEHVKKQILHKLRMNERPVPLKKSDLPEPVQIGYAIKTDSDDEIFNRRVNEDFAKTTQKIIFMTQGLLSANKRKVLSRMLI